MERNYRKEMKNINQVEQKKQQKKYINAKMHIRNEH